MTLGINIQVNDRDVTRTKKSIDAMNKSLRETTGLSDIAIGDAQSTQRVREIADQVRRLQTLARHGQSQGGLLDPRQFREAQQLMQKVAASTQDYFKNLQNVRSEMQRIVQEQKQLRASGEAGSETFNSNRQRMSELARERQGLERHERRMSAAAGGANHASDSITGQQGGAGGMGALLKKGLGFGLAAAGIGIGAGAILSFFGKSRGVYEQAVPTESKLYARGIKGGWNSGVGYGVGPLEYMQLMEHMSSATGLSGGGLATGSKLTAAFSKRFGVDMGSAAGLRSTIYGASGDNSGLPNAVIMSMAQATKKGLDSAKLPELMTLVSRNTQATAAAMGGSAMSKEQVSAATNMAISGLMMGGELGQFAKSSQMYNVMQNGMQSAGTPMGEMILFDALDGFNGQMTFAKKHKMNKIRQEGILKHPQYLSRIMSHFGGTDLEERAGKLEEVMPDLGLKGVGSENFIKLFDKGFFSNLGGKDMMAELKSMASYDKDAENLLKDINNNPALEKEQREARWQEEYLKIGGALNEATRNLDKSMLNLIEGLMGGGRLERLTKAIEELTGKLIPLVEKIVNPTSTVKDYIKKTSPMDMAMDYSRTLMAPFLAGPSMVKSLLGDNYKGYVGTGSGSNKTTDFGSALRTPASIDSSVSAASKKYGLSEALIKSVILAESGGNPRATSKVGAGGLMQLMPATARGLGVTDVYDPHQNVMGGTKFLASLVEKYGGNTDMALAGYNWGPGKVDKYGMGMMPEETKRYIKKVNKGLQGGPTIENAMQIANSSGGGEGVPSAEGNDVISILIAIAQATLATAQNTSKNGINVLPVRQS